MADRDGYVSGIDSRRLASVAKLAGAPAAQTAGLDLHVKLGALVSRGMPLFTIHAEAPGELAYAMSYLATHPIVTLSPSQSA